MTPKVLIVDLSDSPYMDSAGLGLLMNYYVSAQNHGRKILLARVNERIEALLELTKVDGILKSYPTVEAAEADLTELIPITSSKAHRYFSISSKANLPR